MATAPELAADDPVLLAAVVRARKLLRRRALAGAVAGTVPVPGVDWLVDVALLSRMIPAISAEFGLAPEQIARLPGRQREQVETAVGVVGSMLIGKSISKEMVIRAAAAMGKRLAIRQATKYVPLAGQALSAVIGYTVVRRLGEEHIRDCVQVCRQAQLALPAPGAPLPAASARG